MSSYVPQVDTQADTQTRPWLPRHDLMACQPVRMAIESTIEHRQVQTKG